MHGDAFHDLLADGATPPTPKPTEGEEAERRGRRRRRRGRGRGRGREEGRTRAPADLKPPSAERRPADDIEFFDDEFSSDAEGSGVVASGRSAADEDDGDEADLLAELVEPTTDETSVVDEVRPRRRRAGGKDREGEPRRRPSEARDRAERTPVPAPTDEPEGLDDDLAGAAVLGADDDDAFDPTMMHRGAIPTWEDAIGMIISTNLEARQRSPSSGASRPRGRGRGRGRGGR